MGHILGVRNLGVHLKPAYHHCAGSWGARSRPIRPPWARRGHGGGGSTLKVKNSRKGRQGDHRVATRKPGLLGTHTLPASSSSGFTLVLPGRQLSLVLSARCKASPGQVPRSTHPDHLGQGQHLGGPSTESWVGPRLAGSPPSSVPILSSQLGLGSAPS